MLVVWTARNGACAKTVGVDELKNLLISAVTSHRSDQDTARKLTTLTLSERITGDTFTTLLAEIPGPLTATALEDLMIQSAFLDPPETERGSAAAPSPTEQKAIFGRTEVYAAEYVKRLPNLICTELIVRFDDNSLREAKGMRSVGKMRFLDTLSSEVTRVNGAESVHLLTVNGKPHTGSLLLGATTGGEFGNTIVSLMDQSSQFKTGWSHWEMLRGQQIAVFYYSVALANSKYVLSFGCGSGTPRSLTAAYDGFLFIEPASGAIVRITRKAVGLPADFPTRQTDTAIDYGPVSIANHSYLLPIRSATVADNPLACDFGKERIHSLNEIHFSDYRLFEAESKLLFSGDPAKQTPSSNSKPKPEPGPPPQ